MLGHCSRRSGPVATVSFSAGRAGYRYSGRGDADLNLISFSPDVLGWLLALGNARRDCLPFLLGCHHVR
jgi:hypothetical protein